MTQTNLLIGSRALNYWFPQRCVEWGADWDIISKEPIFGAEHHPWEFLNNSEFRFFKSIKRLDFMNEKVSVVNPVGLAIIKRSHLWRSLSFGKHITDYHKYLKPYLPTKSDSEFEFANRILCERFRLTHEAYPQTHPKLNVSVKDFFDDYVTKKYDHDYLHKLVAFYDKPLYTRLQSDSSKAWCEKELWDKLSHQDRLLCIAEEVYVIAIERFMVPNDWNFISRLAYFKALEKVCTTLCSGWFRDYAIDYYPEIVELYNPEKFLWVKQELVV